MDPDATRNMDTYLAQSPFSAFAYRRHTQAHVYEDPFRRYSNRWRERQQHCKEVTELKAQVATLLAENASLRQSITNYQIIDRALQRLFPLIFPMLQRTTGDKDGSRDSIDESTGEEETLRVRPASV
ncbi:hypothetical protein PRIPAC_91271 [Pristionchus pacificus]|uniref:Uncharacterized protein n=1 Tax=Pristionchus pacificus TaxID=54126 RepID=A0A2A6CXQ5_PRIPA|nr:hypothetical protein PRIPAC_91271 [Pristionchus pacificus]|eukprot:PDM82847.1 hypothetical protein PRIPAC_37240 [Pristionchus pacificus]